MKYVETQIQNKAPKSLIISLLLGGMVAVFGGVSHAYFSYYETIAEREIDQTHRRIEQHNLQIQTAQMRSDELLNLFAMRKSLQESGTNLVPIPAGVTEDVTPIKDLSAVSTASNSL